MNHECFSMVLAELLPTSIWYCTARHSMSVSRVGPSYVYVHSVLSFILAKRAETKVPTTVP
jgi:hypothetical protein